MVLPVTLKVAKDAKGADTDGFLHRAFIDGGDTEPSFGDSHPVCPAHCQNSARCAAFAIHALNLRQFCTLVVRTGPSPSDARLLSGVFRPATATGTRPAQPGSAVVHRGEIGPAPLTATERTKKHTRK
ncbi:hypothetical protein GCM10025779_14100 [Arthrobacter cryoconiti]